MNEPQADGISRRDETLRKLFRGEISAVETYRQAIDHAGGHSRVQDLLRLLHEHQQAVEQLRRHLAGRPVVQSGTGVWVLWAKAVQGAANALGTEAQLIALKKGEEHGIDEYEKALRGEQLDPESEALIRTSLLPRQRTHLAMLNRLILEQ